MMLMYTLRRLAGTSLPQCRVNDVQRQQKKLTIGLGMVVILFMLLGTVACGSSTGSLAKGGINLLVVSGQARIQSGEGNTLVVEGDEAVITAGDLVAAEEAEVKLRLADGSLLYLPLDTALEVVTFSDEEGTVKFKLEGELEVEAASPLLTVEISTSVSDAFVMKTMQFTATPTVRDTTFQLGMDDVNAHLTVEEGEVQVTNDGRTETVPAGSKVEAIPGGDLIVSVEPTEEPTEKPTVEPTEEPMPEPTEEPTVAPTPSSEHPAPALVGPENGAEFTGNETILLVWETPTPLAEDEWYEIQLWKEEELPTIVQRVKEGTWQVERGYYPGSYQWRIRIVRGQEDRKETDLSPPSQTWSFSWIKPPPGPVSTAPTSPPSNVDSVDLTVYLRDTNNEQGFAAFSGEYIEAETIYEEGRTVYGDVAVRIGDTVFHFDKTPEPAGVEQLPDPYRLEVQFSESLIAATEGDPWSNPQKAQFGAGTLDCNSAAPADTDKPYTIEMTLYAEGKALGHAEIRFLVSDNPHCGGPGGDEEEGGGTDVGPGRPERP